MKQHLQSVNIQTQGRHVLMQPVIMVVSYLSKPTRMGRFLSKAIKGYAKHRWKDIAR